MVLKQILYLGHWIIKLDRTTFISFLNYAQKKSGRTKTGLLVDIVYSVLRYKISIIEYFQFNFFLAKKEERIKYVGTPLLEEYQLKMNPKSERSIVHNKLKFLEIYAPFIKHGHATLADLQANNDSAVKVLHNKSGKIVLKSIFDAVEQLFVSYLSHYWIPYEANNFWYSGVLLLRRDSVCTSF